MVGWNIEIMFMFAIIGILAIKSYKTRSITLGALYGVVLIANIVFQNGLGWVY